MTNHARERDRWFYNLRRALLPASCLLLPAYCLLVPASLLAQSNPHQPMTAASLHNSALIIDTHADTTGFMLDPNFDLGKDGSTHVNLPKARAGNLGAQFFSIWVHPNFKGQYAHLAMREIDAVIQQAKKNPNDMVMAYSSQDILAARRGPHPRLAALLGLEGGHMIENDLALLRDFYRLGVRYMTLSWSNTNEWADSSGDINNEKVNHHNGLTEFGKDVVREMNRLGMMVDISHVADKTFYDAVAVSRAPIIASHSSARALSNHPRNMTDDMLRALARNGGVVMVNFYPGFVDEDYRKRYAEGEAQRARADEETYQKYKDDYGTWFRASDRQGKEQASKYPRPPFKSLIDHIDHIAKVAGVNHVGLGSDFDGVPSLPQGIDSVADLPKITQALRERGYSQQDIRKVLGGNLLRVFQQVEQVSRELQEEKKNAAAASH